MCLKAQTVQHVAQNNAKIWVIMRVLIKELISILNVVVSFATQVPPKHSYGMLFCSCPLSDQTACSERRRQTIVPVCSYEEKQKPNCLELQASCKTNYICKWGTRYTVTWMSCDAMVYFWDKCCVLWILTVFFKLALDVDRRCRICRKSDLWSTV